MDAKTCQQCHQVTNGTYNRMVQDSCGHEKCRMCLLRDDTKCLACLENFAIDNSPIKEMSSQEHSVISTFASTDREVNSRDIQNDCTVNTNVLISNVLQTTAESEILTLNQSVITKRNVDSGNKNKKYETKETPYNNVNPLKRSPRKSIPTHINVEKCNLTGKQYYTCTVCSRRFRSRSQVSFHIHCNSANPFTCNICQQRFFNCSHFTVHMNIHYGNKIYVCDFCSDSFHQKSKLIRHLLVHTASRPHKCNLCDAAFGTAVGLKRHTMSHSSEKKYDCKTCGKKFRDISNLRKHELKHAGKRYSCTECGKQYTIKFSLLTHMKSHTKDRPETCSYCPKTFYCKKDKKRHELIHLEEKQLQCLLCNIKCRRKDNLVRHFRNTHPDIDRDSIVHNSVEVKSTEKKKNSIIDDVTPKKNHKKPQLADKGVDDIEKTCNTIRKLPESNLGISNSTECIVKGVARDKNFQMNNLTRSEILEANNKRQSVIFNPHVLKTDDKSTDTSVIDNDINKNLRTVESSTVSENHSSKPLLETSNRPVHSVFTAVPPSSYLNSEKYKINDISNIHRRNENTVQYNDAKLTQKKTIDINEEYKQLFSTVRPNDTNRVDNFSAVGSNGIKNDLKVKNAHSGSPVNKSYMPSYVNNYYDHKKYSSEYKYYGSSNMSSYYKNQTKSASHTRGFLCEDSENDNDISPESIELYKKILMPSYKGSSETNSNATASSSKDTVSNRENNISSLLSNTVSKEDVPLPPLVPIDKDNSKGFNDTRSFRSDSHLRDHLTGNMTAINDVHWRRRLALNSNHED